MSDFPAKIVLATDGSRDATLAAQAATYLAARAGSEFYLIHVWREAAFWELSVAGIVGGSHAEERDEAKRLLEDQAEQIRRVGGNVVGVYFKEGRPAEEIARLAGELGAGLVVIGSRGLGAVKRLVMGSVSEGVVQLALCPTLVVRGGETAWPPTRLIVGDDGSEEAGIAGELAASMGKLLGAEVVLVRIYPSIPVFKARRLVHIRVSDEVLRRGKKALERRADKLASLLGGRPRTAILSGDPASVLQEMAEEGEEPSLVVVGRRGPGDVRHSMLGDVSAAVLRAVDGPVLIVPSAG